MRIVHQIYPPGPTRARPHPPHPVRASADGAVPAVTGGGSSSSGSSWSSGSPWRPRFGRTHLGRDKNDPNWWLLDLPRMGNVCLFVD